MASKKGKSAKKIAQPGGNRVVDSSVEDMLDSFDVEARWFAATVEVRDATGNTVTETYRKDLSDADLPRETYQLYEADLTAAELASSGTGVEALYILEDDSKWGNLIGGSAQLTFSFASPDLKE